MNKNKKIKKKLNVLLAIIVVIFIVLTLRVGYLQLMEKDKFQTLARENRVRFISITAPRGHILDCNGEKLVGNRPVYTVSLVRADLQEPEEVIMRLSKILDISPQEIERKLKEREGLPFEPVRLAVDVPLQIVTKIEERRLELPGVVIHAEPVRDYPYKELMAQTLGYVRQIYKEQLERLKDKGYQMGDMYGQAGLENVYDQYLRGENGARLMEVDVQGHPVRNLGVKEAVPGNNLILTVDLELQKAAEKGIEAAIERAHELDHKEARAGALVMLDVHTGEVLAMASHPAYNPDIFTGTLSKEEWDELIENEVLVNRALGLYPPGSTFKPVVAAAALETGKITTDFKIHDPGYFKLGDTVFKDWKPGGHGTVDIYKAIQQSCNTFFWTIGLKVGPEEIARYARMFGLGQKTGIDLNDENSVPVPCPQWKEEVVKARLDRIYGPSFDALEEKYKKLMAEAAGNEEKEELKKKWEQEERSLRAQYNSNEWDWTWHDFDTLNTVIGQGDNRYSPLQLANYTAALANEGVRYRPHLVKKIISPAGEVIKEFKPEVIGEANVSEKTFAVINEGMLRVTQPGGTAAGTFWGFPVKVAGKSGTSEVKGHDNHAVFVAFAPYEKPEVALACVIEYGGGGSAVAAVAVRDTLAAYFGLVQVDGKWMSKEEAKALEEARALEDAKNQDQGQARDRGQVEQAENRGLNAGEVQSQGVSSVVEGENQNENQEDQVET